MKPMMAIAAVTTMIGLGQPTTGVAILRQPRGLGSRFGSNRPNREPITRIAGATVRAANTTTNSAIAHGSPMVWKYGSLVAGRHKQAPAKAKPDPKMTWDTP